MTFAMWLMLAAALLSAAGPLWNVTLGPLLGMRRLPWNATQLALAFNYFASQGWWLIAGDVDIGVMFMIDVTSVAFIFCKATARCQHDVFLNGRHQLRCMVESLTTFDRVVLGLFALAAWPSYVFILSAFWLFWICWWVMMLQFLAAGSEAFLDWRKARATAPESCDPSSGMMFAVARARRWST